jgi:pimeloyl-ACP methyl ester carboxylesterase
MDLILAGPVRERRLAGLAVDNLGCTDSRAPLLLLHGLSFDRRMWRPALSRLHEIDPARRILAVDLPGHGGSDDQASYDLDDVLETIHKAVAGAGLIAPVVVGHSGSALAATVYAGRYPSRGVVSVDRTLDASAFGAFLGANPERFRGPGFHDAWHRLFDTMEIDRLPAAASGLLRATSHPREEVIDGYWRVALDGHGEEFLAAVRDATDVLARDGTPYRLIAGTNPGPAYRAWLRRELPQAVVEVWPLSGHFPHLAHPDRFARRLAATGAWGVVNRRVA